MYSIINHPERVETLLFIIKEDLKKRKSFDKAYRQGLNNGYYESHLGSAILTCVELYVDMDREFDLYYELAEKHSKEMEDTEEAAALHASKIYAELLEKRESRLRQ